jgi:hypothetical protein
MMVRDHEATIEKSLRSVRHLIDYWVIVDVGSDGDTAAVIDEVLGGIPGELHSRGFVDFSYNYTELIGLAHGKADYLLLVDADMTVVCTGSLPELDQDAYVVSEVGGEHHLAVPRVVRGSRRWWYEGSTHEVLATNGTYSEAELDVLTVERHSDEASRRRRLLENLGILLREDASGRSTPRTFFLLGETLHALGRPEQAIGWYRRRVELGASDQETFCANLQEGALRAKVDFPSSIPVLLEAWQRRPTRAEPLYELARGYRMQGDAFLAYQFASIGLQIPYPTDTLLVQRWVYDWGLRMERAWAAGRLGWIAEADDDLQAVLKTEGVPAEYIEVVRNWLDNLVVNLLGSGETSGGQAPIEAVPPLHTLVSTIRIGRLQLALESNWVIHNPSISADGDGFLMTVRSENVVGFEKGRLRFGGGTRDNVSYLVKLDSALGVASVDRIDEDPEGSYRYESRQTGFMDLRSTKIDGRWVATGSSRQLSPSNMFEMAVLELDGARVTRIHRLVGSDPERHEKNWMPFVHRGELHFIYTCGPMVVLRYERQTGVTLATQSESPDLASGFRGGSQGIALDDGSYLFVVHEMYHRNGLRSYLHRFIQVDSDLRLSAISPPFTFTDDVREFCAGAATHGSELVLSFGIRHTEAWLAVVPLVDAVALLEPIRRP